MDDKTHRPIRTSQNKIKDLYNAYVRNEGSRVIPITEPEQEKPKHTPDEKPKQQTEEKSKPPRDDKPDHQPAPETKEASEIQFTDLESKASESVEDLVMHIALLEKENDELKEQLVRKVAELDNMRRRTIKEKSDLIEYGNEKLLSRMVELLDDMKSATEAARKSTDYPALQQGLELIYHKAQKLFEESGVKPMDDPAGKPFDLNYHEAIMHIGSDLPENTVVQQVQPGYMIRDRVLRHAKVITSAGSNTA